MVSREDDVANTVEETLSDSDVAGVGTALWGGRPVDAKAIRGLALWISQQQTDAQWEHIEASLQAWRVETDLDARLNCHHCKESDTIDHYTRFCREPTVAVAQKST